MEALLPRRHAPSDRRPACRSWSRQGRPGARRVALLAGCVQRVFFPGVNEATLRVLSAEGCDVVVPPDQGCCGALSIHAGREEEALEFARTRSRDSRRRSGRRASTRSSSTRPAAARRSRTTGASSRGRTGGPRARRAFSSKVRDVSEFLAGLTPFAPRHPIRARVAYHDACHLAHAQRHPGAAAAAPRGNPGPRAPRDSRGRPVLRQRRHLQPRRARERRGDRRAQGGQRPLGPARTSWPAPIPAARSRSGSFSAGAARRSRPPIRSRSWTPRSRVGRSRAEPACLGVLPGGIFA